MAFQTIPWGDDHPDTNLLAGFADHVLSDEERVSVLTHLANCEVCRECLALITEADGPQDARRNASDYLLKALSREGLASIAAGIVIFSIVAWQFSYRMSSQYSEHRKTATVVSKQKQSQKEQSAHKLTVELTKFDRTAARNGTRPLQARARIGQAARSSLNQHTETHFVVPKDLLFSQTWHTVTFTSDGRASGTSNDRSLKRTVGLAYKDITFQSVALTGLDAKWGSTASEMPGPNQIALKTQLGEKWISLNPLFVQGDDR